MFLKLLALVACLSSALSVTAQLLVNGIYYCPIDNVSHTVMVTNQYGNFDPRPLYSVGSSYTGAVTIPSTVDISGTTYTVTAIGPYAFVNCTGLTSVTLPNTITQIGSYAFADNVSSSFYFSTITIPNSVTTINDHAFYNTRLTTLYLGFGVETIGDYAFYESHYYLNDVYCYALLPPTIQSNTFFGTYYYSPTLHTLVYSNDFYKNDVDWKKFSTITTISGSTAYDAQIGGLYYQMVPWPESPGYYAKVVNNGNYNCYTSSSYTVPATVSWRSESFIVRYIENSAFRNCTNVSTLDLRNATNLKYIRDYACYGCTNLGTVRLSPALTSIGAYAFYDCTYLRNLYTNNSTPPTIQSTTFTSSQYNYASLYVPKPADVATYQAAPYWSNFTKYYAVQAYDFYTGGIYYLITGSNTVKVVNKYGSDYAFNEGEFSYSGNVSIPATVTYNGTTYRVTAIGENAFRESRAVNKNGAGETPRNQGDLKTVTIGDNVTTIEPNAFRDCTGLTSVTLGTGVTSIGAYAFNGCTSLYTVNSNRSTPPTIQSSTFDSNHYSTTKVYVPKSAINSYKNKIYWKNFYVILPNDGTELDYALNVEGGNIHFTTGNYPWYAWGDGTRVYARSYLAGVSFFSDLTAVVSVTTESIVTFDFYTISRTPGFPDPCAFSIDGEAKFYVSTLPMNDWSTVSYELPAGTHTLKWSYTSLPNNYYICNDFFVDNVAITAKPSQTGDVNGDGSTTIADVTALIDSLLSGVEVPLDAADVNGDGSVTIADVTALIDMLLGS